MVTLTMHVWFLYGRQRTPGKSSWVISPWSTRLGSPTIDQVKKLWRRHLRRHGKLEIIKISATGQALYVEVPIGTTKKDRQPFLDALAAKCTL
ncbi:MAG: hypothetical protein AAB883_03210 [Patescibacteria group bacterium]|mgnify:CR=1